LFAGYCRNSLLFAEATILIVSLLPCDHARCTMPHRSPPIFWLLLAATICVDAVAFSWADAEPDPYGFLVFDALVLSQISVVCIWSGLRSEKSMWTRFSPLLAVVLATLVWGMFSETNWIGRVGEEWSLRMGLIFVHQGLHAALLLAMLWLLKRTPLWKRRYDWAAEWQFSIADLLVVITVVAVLGAGMRFTKLFVDLDWVDADIVLIGGPAVLAMSGVFIWSLWRAPWILRASGVIGVAIGLAAVALLAEWTFSTAYPVVVATKFLIQAVVLMAWLAWGPLLPRARPATSGNKA
jgi:hypothetical protein